MNTPHPKMLSVAWPAISSSITTSDCTRPLPIARRLRSIGLVNVHVCSGSGFKKQGVLPSSLGVAACGTHPPAVDLSADTVGLQSRSLHQSHFMTTFLTFAQLTDRLTRKEIGLYFSPYQCLDRRARYRWLASESPFLWISGKVQDD